MEEIPEIPAEPPKSKIPVPSSIYLSHTLRTGYLTDLSEQVFLPEEEEKKTWGKGVPSPTRRRLERVKSSLEETTDTDLQDIGPPGILTEPVEGLPLRGRRSRFERRSSSIELIGPSETFDIDGEDSAEELLSEALEEEEDGRAKSATFQRFSPKQKKAAAPKKAKTVDEKPSPDKPERSPKAWPSKKEEKKPEDIAKKWAREPVRPLSTTKVRTPAEGSRTPSKSPAKSPAPSPKKELQPKDKKSPSPSPSPTRYPARPPSAVPTGTKKVKKVEIVEPPKSPKKVEKEIPKRKPEVEKPTSADTEKWRVQPDGKKKEKKEPEAPIMEPKAHSSRAPKAKPNLYGKLDAGKLEERMKEEEVRDTAAGMRLLQLCQAKDWYGVDGHLRYLEKRVETGVTQNKKPLAGVKDEGNGWTPLMYAIKDNALPMADRLMVMGCDMNEQSKEGGGLSCIHLAVLHGRDDTVRYLIGKKVDVTIVTKEKQQNLLHVACTRNAGNTASILRALLVAMPKDARLQKDADGDIPLFIALKTGNIGACQELLAGLGQEQLEMKTGPDEDTPLHMAVKKKDMEICRIFVDAGSNVNATNKDGQTPLHVASTLGDDNLVKFFYLCKANPHLVDKEDRTALHLAAMNGHTNLIDLLTDKFKVSVFERTRDGSTLMHIASLHGHPETAMALFRKGVPLQMPNKGGARSIHISARHGHAGMISKLLEKGENVDSTTNDNFTALHIAVEAVKPAVVECLLGYGAQVHIQGGKNKETPLHIAARVVGGEKCALMLLKSGADPNIAMENGETPMHVAARHGRILIVRLLLQDGANPQQRGRDGDTPLHFACRYGHIHVVEALLQHVKTTKSANECTLFINMVTTKGESALHYAARLNPTKIKLEESEEGLDKEEIGKNIVKMLLDGGASTSRQTKDANETAFHYCAKEGNNSILLEILSRLTPVECQRALNRQSSKGWSPLLIASRRGHSQVVETLLEYHARVDVFDNEGRSGLHLAAENGYQVICGILLEHRAFINAKSRVGLTALHLAATKGFTKLCLFLIQTHGAAVDALTLKKQTPLHLAAESGQLEVCRLLMGLRANPDATDDKGQKPIHLAAQNNHANVIKLFLKHSSALVNSFTKDGSTCAHLAAMQGSVAVLEELMKFDKQGVINARNRSTDATALQLAAEGGHADLVNALLAAGASASDENRLGYTAAHLAAKNGHTNVLEALRNAQEDSINITSRKLGTSALHIAAYYGQTETVRELLQYISATSTTDPPLSVATAFIKEIGTESGLTPLHMAAYSGEENVVRLLLNFEGVQVDAGTTNFGFNPLHLACRGGHSTVVGLLLSRSSELLESKDTAGRSSLHIAAIHGHKQMEFKK